MKGIGERFRVAVITQVYNENFFLPIWLNHYGTIFGYENLIVIDDGSDDGSVNDPRIMNLVQKKRTLLDELDRATLISLFHESLLSYYDAIIYTDCDELIVLDPGLGINLCEYLGSVSWTTLNVCGFHVMHDRFEERSLDLDEPLFSQRRFILFDKEYCKPLLSRQPIRWSPGFHTSDKVAIFDENLFMFHLRSVDYERSRSRIRVLNNVQFSNTSLNAGHGFQFRLSEDIFLKMLYDDPNEGISRALDLDVKDALREFLQNEPFNLSVLKVPHRFEESIQLDSKPCIAIEKDSPAVNISCGNQQAPTKRVIQRIFNECLDKMIFTRERSRLLPCPCGSSLRYKHCHGAHQT